MLVYLFLITCIFVNKSVAQLKTKDFHFRVEAGDQTCFYELGMTGQMMEVYYQVVDGQHGDLDISLDVIDPTGTKIASDYKKSQNAIIKDLTIDGDYAICLDNTFSKFNSKLVYVYVTLESVDNETEAVVTVLNSEGQEVPVETMTMIFHDENAPYYIEVEVIADSLTRTLKHVVKARHMLDVYSASKSRDSHLAFKETFVVYAWSGFQISLMFLVGMLQVFMIKNLFKSPMHQ